MTITVTRMGEKGDGIAPGHIIPRSLPGEDYSDHLTRLTSSPERVAAFCPVFDICGGCKLQHWAQAPYAEWKRGLLVAALGAKGLEPEIGPLIDAQGAGRRRVVLHMREVGGAWRAGLMAQGSHHLVPIDHCPILVPALQDAPLLAEVLGPYFGASDMSVTVADNGLDVAIKSPRKVADAAFAPLAAIMKERGIVRLSLNGEALVQHGVPLIKMGQAQVPLSVGGFLQATAEGEEMLAAEVLRNVGKAKRVADLFCGQGPFALRLAEKASVAAFDSDKPAIAALQSAIRTTLGLKPNTAQARDLFHSPLTPMELNEFDAVVLDPPRAGAEVQCRHLAKSKVRRAVYVSCDAQTFARDAALLAAGHYQLREVTPVDQFKYSPHLESVALFQRA